MKCSFWSSKGVFASRDEQQLFYRRQCRGRRLSSVIGAHDAWAVMNDSLIFRLCAVSRPAAIDTITGEACISFCFVLFFFFSFSNPLLFADRNRHRLPAPLRYLATGFHRLLRLLRLIYRGSKRIVSCLMNPVTHSLSQSATTMHADKLTRRVASTPFFSLKFHFPGTQRRSADTAVAPRRSWQSTVWPDAAEFLA